MKEPSRTDYIMRIVDLKKNLYKIQNEKEQWKEIALSICELFESRVNMCELSCPEINAFRKIRKLEQND